MKVEEAYPLYWPAGRPRTNIPRFSRFGGCSFATARNAIFKEIARLGGTNVILSTDIPLRLDGLPYSNRSQPEDKGVAVYFLYKKKPMVFACDEWNKVEHNAWAIAKTIEALLGIERWGSGDMLERAFTGFTQLPTPSQKKHWREVLNCMGVDSISRGFLIARRNALATLHHPDMGGDGKVMAGINTAFKEAMEELF